MTFYIIMLFFMLLLFAPTILAFISFVHKYNHHRFFDAVELNSECQVGEDEIQAKLAEIIDTYANAEDEPRFYDYIRELDRDPNVQEFTCRFPVYRPVSYTHLTLPTKA